MCLANKAVHEPTKLTGVDCCVGLDSSGDDAAGLRPDVSVESADNACGLSERAVSRFGNGLDASRGVLRISRGAGRPTRYEPAPNAHLPDVKVWSKAPNGLPMLSTCCPTLTDPESPRVMGDSWSAGAETCGRGGGGCVWRLGQEVAGKAVGVLGQSQQSCCWTWQVAIQPRPPASSQTHLDHGQVARPVGPHQRGVVHPLLPVPRQYGDDRDALAAGGGWGGG